MFHSEWSFMSNLSLFASVLFMKSFIWVLIKAYLLATMDGSLNKAREASNVIKPSARSKQLDLYLCFSASTRSLKNTLTLKPALLFTWSFQILHPFLMKLFVALKLFPYSAVLNVRLCWKHSSFPGMLVGYPRGILRRGRNGFRYS